MQRDGTRFYYLLLLLVGANFPA